MTGFDTWANDVAETYGLYDIAEKTSIRFALAAMIINGGPIWSCYKPKGIFALMVRSGASKQIAGAVFQDIKQKQIEAFKTEQAALAQKKAAEATANNGDPSNVIPIQNP